MDKYIKIDTVKKTLLDYIHEFDEYRANPDFVRGKTIPEGRQMCPSCENDTKLTEVDYGRSNS